MEEYEISERQIIGRDKQLFKLDSDAHENELADIVRTSRFLVIGGGGTIGQALALEIFKRDPKALHIVDLSENNMVELVREIRSTVGYLNGEFKTFAIDCSSLEFAAMYKLYGPYDYIFNLSALKHVRSESDPFTLMRMINVNILNNLSLFNLIKDSVNSKYFCVSTDKATDPVNMMVASKRIMELFATRESNFRHISMARFANVAFSDGSLLQGFCNRLDKIQPISAPYDVQRYFVTKKESGQLCLLAGLLGNNKETFFPKLSDELNLLHFDQIARKFLNHKGYKVYECKSEDEAREKISTLPKRGYWPCYFFKSDTTGEKDFEEFHSYGQKLSLDRFLSIGIIHSNHSESDQKLDYFLNNLNELKKNQTWSRSDLVKLFNYVLDNFDHLETGKFLNDKM